MLSKTSRVISSKARNLAECPGEKGLLGKTKVSFVATDANAPRRPCARSLGASFCRDDTIDEILVLVDNCYIITNFIDCCAMHEIRLRLGKMQTSLLFLSPCTNFVL